jgi:signal transduction histidine kinase
MAISKTKPVLGGCLVDSFYRLLSYRKTLLFSVAAMLLLALFEISMYVFLKSEYEERRTNYISTLSNSWDKGYQSVIHHFKMVTDTVMFGLGNDNRLKEILQQVNNTKDIETAHNQLLDTYTELDFINQAHSFIRIFQVNDKSGNALIRFQKPDRYGDNVLTYLEIIISTHKNKSFMHGFEGGKYFNAYRFVYPVIKNGEFLGSVQLGFEESAINEHMLGDFMVNSYFAVDTAKNKISEKETVASSLSTPNRQFVHHVKAYPKEKQQLMTSFFKDKQKELAEVVSKNGKLMFPSEINGKHYIVTAKPFVDFANTKSGYIVLYGEDANLVFMQKEYFISLALGLALAFFMWLITMLAFVRYYKTSSKLAKEIQKREEQERLLLQQSKMAMMGEMIGAIAHQWRQPLNYTSIVVHNLCADYEDGNLNAEAMNEFKKSITETIKKMSDTIDDFRNFFKPTKSKIDFFAEDAVESTLKIMKPQLKKQGIECAFEADAKHPVFGYKNELEQAIMILVSNAMDALVSTKTKNPQIQITIKNTAENRVSISIKDNAGGVAEEIKEKIFEPYFSTKGESEGTGIGLYMATEIAQELMGSKLYLENIDGGACFTIDIPSQKRVD